MSITKRKRGYTLVELIVSIGLFAFVMMLTSSVYLMMIGIGRQARGIATGIDNLSFALETMSRTIRTSKNYSCGSVGGDCPNGDVSFTVTSMSGKTVTYSLNAIDKTIQQQVQGVDSVPVPLTDPSVQVTSLKFYASGVAIPPTDYFQPHVTVIVSGKVSHGQGKPAESFTVETSATMRGTDI